MLAVIALLGLVAVVVADRRVHRDAIDDVAVGLVEGEEPVVVLVPAALVTEERARQKTRQLVPQVDVVARGQEQARTVLVDRALQRHAHLPLPAGGVTIAANADAVVAEQHEIERGSFVRRRVSVKGVVIAPAGGA